MTHALKTIQPYFNEVLSGEKTFEVRKADRPFNVGDILKLQEYNSDYGYTGAEHYLKISYILPGGQFGIDENYCVLGIKEIEI